MRDDWPTVEPILHDKPKPTLPYNIPVTVPIKVCPKPTKADIAKMGLWRFGRGFAGGLLGSFIACASMGLRGVTLLAGTVIGATVAGFGMGVDKVVREARNGKATKGQLNVELAAKLVEGGDSVASLGWIPDMLIQYLDEFLVKVADLAPDSADRHIQTACWLIQHYEADLHALALKSTNTVDDAVVDEAVAAAKRIYPVA